MKNSSREQDEKFLSSRQENIRLAIALERFFELCPEDGLLYERYREYLKKRFRPAMEKLMKARETEKVKVLFGNSIFFSAILNFLSLPYPLRYIFSDRLV